MMKHFNSKMTFDEWVEFVFDHPIDAHETSWYSDNALDIFWEEWRENTNLHEQLSYATQLFRNPSFLLDKYNPEQIDEGFWLLLAGPYNFALDDLLWNGDLSLDARKQCILSMTRLFQTVFVKIPEQSACNMWWDLLRPTELSPKYDDRIVEIMLTAIIQILEIPVRECQVSGLHGLGHLEHPDKKRIIEEYLRKNPEIDVDTRNYAIAAMEGKIL